MCKILKTLTIAACASIALSAAAVADTTIRVSVTPSILKTMFEKLVAAFEADHPSIKVDLEVPAGEQDEHLQGLLRQAVVDRLPDVTFQSYNFIRTLADRDIAVPLDRFVASDPGWTPEVYAESVTSTGMVNDKVYALGIGASFSVLYYNADLVRRAQNGDATFPGDWSDIVALARKIGGVEDGVVGGYHRFHPWFFQAHVNSRGGQMMNADETEVLFAGKEGLAALRVVQGFGEAGQAASAMTREQARQAFVSGTIGLFTDSSGLLAQHIAQIGDRFELGVARWPILAANGGVPASGVAVMMLAEEERQQQAAWTFMTFAAGPKGQEIVVRNSAYVPVNGRVIDQSASLRDFFAQNPLMRVALETSSDAVAWHAFPGQNTSRIDKAIYDTVEAVSTLRLPPDDGLKRLKTQIEGML